MADQEGKSLIEMGLRQGIFLPIAALNDACMADFMQMKRLAVDYLCFPDD